MPNQDNIIEQLTEVASLRGFFALSVNQFSQSVEQLIERVFRKADFALKSVVDSLFEHQGPLAELPVRLKLLLGLGVLSADIFQDISAFIEFKQILSDEVEEHSFASPITLAFIKQLKHIDLALIESLQKMPHIADKESIQFQMQQLRLERVVRSSLILAITEINEKLNVESPL